MAVIKYDHAKIVISSNKADLPSEIVTYLEELDVFENEVKGLTQELAQVDASISKFKDTMDKLADEIYEIGNSAVKLVSNDGSVAANRYLALAKLTVKGVGYLSSKVKEKEAQDKYNQRVDAILSKKQEIAQAKISHVKKELENGIKNILPRFDKMYEIEFSKYVDINDEIIQTKINLYKKALCLVIKARFLCDTLDYFLCEMEAWKEGLHNSYRKIPTILTVLQEEIEGWNSILNEKGEWDNYVKSILSKKSGVIPLPMAALLSDPCLLRNFVGINLGEADTCPKAIISLTKNDASRQNPLVLNNVYYIHSQNIMDNMYNPPKGPSKFGVKDIGLILVLPILAFFATLLMCRIVSGIGWRFFFMIPILCWLALGVEYLETHYDRLFPYVSSKDEYEQKIKEFKETLRQAQDCQEVHQLS